MSDHPSNDTASDAPSDETVAPLALHVSRVSASLTVNDLAASLTWYRDVAGFSVLQEYVRGGALRAVAVRAGAIDILLGQDDGAKGLDRKKGEGISLMLTTHQDIDALAAGMVARGAVLATEPADAFGARVFRVRDPDGFLFVISSER